MTEARDDGNAAHCAALVRSHDFPRYASTLFVGPERRRALLALHAFNIEVAGVRDHVTQPLAGEIRLQWWGDLLGGTEHGAAQGNPVAAELLRAKAACGWPVEALTRIVDAHRFDLYDDPMSGMAALEAYLEAAEGVLFSLAAEGASSEAVRRAALASGLAWVLELLPLHASRGQCFLPADVLRRHGADLDMVLSGQASEELRKVLDDLREMARAHLTAAQGHIANLPRETRVAFLPLALIKPRLDRIDTAHPFSRASLSRLKVLWTLWRASRG